MSLINIINVLKFYVLKVASLYCLLFEVEKKQENPGGSVKNCSHFGSLYANEEGSIFKGPRISKIRKQKNLHRPDF